jgi:pimeloyl-ACP methyl ester carboxylesterase
MDFELNIDGKRIEANWHGPRPDSAPTIILLHEGLGCVAMWRDFPQRLAEQTGCGVLVYSRFGYGKSDPVTLPRPLTYMHDEALQVLPRVLDAAKIEKAILVGHSDGASIAAIYAGGVQDFRVRGLVLLAPHFFVEAVSITSIQAAKAAYETTDLRQRRRYCVPRLERCLARSWLPFVAHRGRDRAHPGADAADPGRAGRVRHAGPARARTGGELLPGRGAGAEGLPALAAPRSAGGNVAGDWGIHPAVAGA